MAVDNRLKLTFLHGGVMQYRAGEILKPRVMRDYELVLILEGNVTYQANQRNYAAPPGCVILARPGFQESYRWDPLGPTRHAFFHFRVERMPRVAGRIELVSRPPPARPGRAGLVPTHSAPMLSASGLAGPAARP